MIVYLVLLLILLLLSGFFSSSETAFLSLERVQLDHLVRERRPGAARVAALLERPSRLLAAILLGNNLANTGAAAVGTVIAAQLVSGGQAALLATLAITALLVVFGEVAPKTVALQHNFALTRWYARPIAVWAALMRPLVAALDTLSRGMLTLVGAQRGDDRALTLGELRTAITMGAESGALQEEASDMMLGALALQQQQARSIMVHRVNMVTAAAGDSIATVAERMAEHGYLRLPVYVDGPDDIVGYVHVSDVSAAYAGSRAQTPVREVMREAVFESELAPISRVLERMKQEASYLVVLVDEFGATAGLVTLEDVMEVLVGEIRSESGNEPVVADTRVGDRRVVEGQRLLAELGEELGVDLAHPEAETVGGLVLAYLRHFPQPGESLEHASYRFTVAASDERRVTLVAVEPAPEQPRSSDEGGASGE